MKAYSYDLRQRVLRAVDQGRPRAEIVIVFAISLATLKRYLKLRRETGDVKPKAIPGRPAKKGAALQAGLQSQLDAYPDATLEEHGQIWEITQGVQVSTASMSRAIQRLNWTRKKKKLCASEQKEADRAAWQEQAGLCRRMRFQHRFDSLVCPIPQRKTGVRFCSTQPTSQYDPSGFALTAGHGRSAHP